MNPNYPQTTETLVLAHIDENGKTYTASRTIHTEHPTIEKQDISYEEARALVYEDLDKLKKEN